MLCATLPPPFPVKSATKWDNIKMCSAWRQVAEQRVFEKKIRNKCRDIYFAFTFLISVSFIFFSCCVSFFLPILALLCRLVLYYLRKARNELKNHSISTRFTWDFLFSPFIVPSQVQFLFLEREKINEIARKYVQ